MKRKDYTFYVDESEKAWLAVPMEDIEELGLSLEGRKHENVMFLEEGEAANAFLDAAFKNRWKVQTSDKYFDEEIKVEDYPAFAS